MLALKKKILNQNLALHLQELEKEQTQPQTGRRKEIIKIKATINTIEIKNNRENE